MRIFGITGFKNSGKTTLVVELVEEFTRRKLSVATIKHAHHEFDIDHPGKDSYLHRQAGAREVIVSSSRRWAHIVELNDRPEPDVDELVGRLGDVDLVLIEGFKHGRHPRLEVRRGDGSGEAVPADAPGLCALVLDELQAHPSLPVLERANVAGIADFIIEHAEQRGTGHE
ncbi:MAG TPA: molybdopterin-guanine dinucleotide biosynthesis protein B [Chromatiales bacterium]|nr:molybdopterin-guanine dinucleotide biosynthesis protein B [Chromatiales bacterium]